MLKHLISERIKNKTERLKRKGDRAPFEYKDSFEMSVFKKQTKEQEKK